MDSDAIRGVLDLTKTEIEKDLESLGIIAEVQVPHGIMVIFKNDEDRNLYRLTGKLQESYMALFYTNLDMIPWE